MFAEMGSFEPTSGDERIATMPRDWASRGQGGGVSVDERRRGFARVDGMVEIGRLLGKRINMVDQLDTYTKPPAISSANYRLSTLEDFNMRFVVTWTFRLSTSPSNQVAHDDQDGSTD
jgi:hypothetical protein